MIDRVLWGGPSHLALMSPVMGGILAAHVGGLEGILAAHVLLQEAKPTSGMRETTFQSLVQARYF